MTLLRTCPEVLEYYQRKFRYVLVDEYQDTNHLQYLLTALLAGERKNLCVVGDDDQSIYRFRGANIENILSFEKQYPKARLIRLEQNYRSTQNILDAANAVIANNTGRKGKTLWTEERQRRARPHPHRLQRGGRGQLRGRGHPDGGPPGPAVPGPRRALPHQRPVQRPGIRHEAQRHRLPHRGRH